MTLPIDEFIRRFLMHVLPSGFMRIRHYGILANRSREEKLNLCRINLGQSKPEKKESETFEAIMLRLTGTDVHLCKVCKKGHLQIVEVFLPLFEKGENHPQNHIRAP